MCTFLLFIIKINHLTLNFVSCWAGQCQSAWPWGHRGNTAQTPEQSWAGGSWDNNPAARPEGHQPVPEEGPGACPNQAHPNGAWGCECWCLVRKIDLCVLQPPAGLEDVTCEHCYLFRKIVLFLLLHPVLEFFLCCCLQDMSVAVYSWKSCCLCCYLQQGL